MLEEFGACDRISLDGLEVTVGRNMSSRKYSGMGSHKGFTILDNVSRTEC